jgi:flagellar protein FlaI
VSLKKFVRKMVTGYKFMSKEEGNVIPVRIVGQSNLQPVTMRIQTIQPAPINIAPAEYEATEITESGEACKEAKLKSIKVKGFVIPKFSYQKVTMPTLGEIEITKKPINLKYSLIPRVPAKDEPVLAYAHIYWNPQTNKYVYEVVEPLLSDEIKKVIEKVKDLLEQKLDIDFSRLKKFEAIDYLHKQVDEIIGYYSFKLTDNDKEVIHYYIQRDFIGIGKIETLMNDEEIEDISCDGLNIPLFVYHRNPELGSIETNIFFEFPEELDSYVLKLSQLCGKSISVASPLVDGSLPDGSRVQATLATDIARRGSNFTIRKFTEEPLTPIHLLQYNTLDVQILSFLWLAVDYGRSILISGGTASGKTSLLNVLSLFIRPDKKICSIEDTAELKLPHPHWVPAVARIPMSIEDGKKIGEVDMFDLLKESLRQRPDYIVVGEVRGKEAYVLFQQMATGHPSLATIHAENIPKLIDRLTTPPIELPPSLLGSLDLVVFLLRIRRGDKHVRRINEVLEIVEVDNTTNKPVTNRVFRWEPKNDVYEIVGESSLMKKISESTGISEKELMQELERRMCVLNWLKQNRIFDYKDVFRVFNIYYTYPERVLATIMGGA